MGKILVIGEVLVEIMADTKGEGFLETQALTGPFPSGAPAIFADQVAKLSHPVALVSAVGEDDFGRINLDRLVKDGVDIAAITVDRERPTGSAFVRYRADGSRDFVFNIAHSACGHLHGGASLENLIAEAGHLHIMGTSLSSADFIALNLRAANAIRDRGGTVSFDPNVRKEISSQDEMADVFLKILALTDLFLPSGDELTHMANRPTVTDAVSDLFARGVKAVVHKRGAEGASYYGPGETLHQAGFPVVEVDPTGAGDCFGATFTALWLRGTAPADALRLAAASGAMAVTRRGPMEGVADLATLEAFATKHGRPSP